MKKKQGQLFINGKPLEIANKLNVEITEADTFFSGVYMTKEDIKSLIKLLKAYADGKEIQMWYGNEWGSLPNNNIELVLCDYPKNYRIKPKETT